MTVHSPLAAVRGNTTMRLRAAGPAPGRGPIVGRPPPGSKLALWIPAIYAAVSVCWIAFSDAFLSAVAPSAQDLARWSTEKGVGFIAVTTVALHAGIRWAIGRERLAERALRSALRRYELLAEHTRDVILFIRRASTPRSTWRRTRSATARASFARTAPPPR